MFIVKSDSEEFGLFNNRDESTIEREFWIWMSTAKSAECIHTVLLLENLKPLVSAQCESIVTCWVLGTMVNQMKNQTVDIEALIYQNTQCISCLLYTSPSPRDRQKSRMPSSA